MASRAGAPRAPALSSIAIDGLLQFGHGDHPPVERQVLIDGQVQPRDVLGQVDGAGFTAAGGGAFGAGGVKVSAWISSFSLGRYRPGPSRGEREWALSGGPGVGSAEPVAPARGARGCGRAPSEAARWRGALQTRSGERTSDDPADPSAVPRPDRRRGLRHRVHGAPVARRPTRRRRRRAVGRSGHGCAHRGPAAGGRR